MCVLLRPMSNLIKLMSHAVSRTEELGFGYVRLLLSSTPGHPSCYCPPLPPISFQSMLFYALQSFYSIFLSLWEEHANKTRKATTTTAAGRRTGRL